MTVDDASTESAAAEVLPAKPEPALKMLDALLSLINEIPGSRKG